LPGKPGRPRTGLPTNGDGVADTPGGRSGRLVGVGGEALAAAAFGRRTGVVEHELVVQALAHEIDRGAVDHRLAGGVDIDPHAVLFADGIAFAFVAGQFDLVAPARAPGALHAETQPEGLGGAGEELADAVE